MVLFLTPSPQILRPILPSHPPDSVIEVVDDDAELPYLRGVAHVRSYACAVIVIAHSDDAQCLPTAKGYCEESKIILVIGLKRY